jgi:hypothetical protein
MLLLVTQTVFFRKIHVFHQLCWIGLLQRKRAYLHFEKPAWPEIFLPKTNSILRRKQSGRCCCFSHKWFSFERCMCFFNSDEEAYLEQNEPICSLKNLLVGSILGTNVLNGPASNTNGFLLRVKCDLSTQLNSPIWNKESLSPYWKTYVGRSISSKS